MLSPLLTFKETQQVLRICQPYLLELLHTGQLRGAKLGKCWRISEEAIGEFLAKSEQRSGGGKSQCAKAA